MASFPGEETKRPPLLSTPVPFTTSVANATLKHLAVFEYNPLQLEAVRFASTFRAGVLDTQDIFGDFYRYLPMNLRRITKFSLMLTQTLESQPGLLLG